MTSTFTNSFFSQGLFNEGSGIEATDDTIIETIPSVSLPYVLHWSVLFLTVFVDQSEQHQSVARSEGEHGPTWVITFFYILIPF